jgi:hypothetical protein
MAALTVGKTAVLSPEIEEKRSEGKQGEDRKHNLL